MKTQQDALNYAKTLSPKDLVLLLNKYDNAYYNKKPLVRDSIYDVIREVAVSRQGESKLIADYLKKIGHKPSRKFVKLPYRMASLNKIKPGTGEVDKFAKGFDEFVLIDKEDGISGLLEYKDGELPNIYSRGTDDEGQNINRIRPHLDIPQSVHYDKLPVDGEIIMPEKTFYSKYANDFENPRNMTIGLTGRLKGDNSAAKDLHFLAYGIKNSKMKPSAQLSLLKKLGFNVPYYTIVDSINDKMLTEYLADRKKKSPYEIDGIVIHRNIVSSDPLSGNPKNTVAFKVNTTDEMVEAIVTDIQWTASQYGKLNPVIQIKPIRMKGVTISNATGHNAFFITHGYKYSDRQKYNNKKFPIGKNSIVLISRSGDVIPKVEQVVKPAKEPLLPKIPYEWDERGVSIFVSDKTEAKNIRIKQLTHFFATIGVEGLKEATVKLLVDNGYTSILSILKMTKQDFLLLPRTQETMATKLVTNIKQALAEATIEQLADAVNVFGSGFGERRAKLIFDKYPNILNYDEAKARSLILNIQGFSVKTTDQFIKGMSKFAKFLDKIGYKQSAKGTRFRGQSICFTGVRSDALEKLIKLNGGSVTDTVTKATTLLIVKDLNSTSSKVEKAKANKIPIMTIKQFEKQVG